MGQQRKTVGVLISILDSFYQSDLWTGLRDEAKRLGHNVLLFCGMPLLSPISQEIQDNAIYSLINRDKIDGLVIETGTISNYLDSNDFMHYLQQYKPLPIVSVSVDLPGHYGILLDNRSSMYNLVDHVIGHGFEKIAMVTGPMTNSEAVDRLKGYKDALAAYDIAYDETLVYEGNFTQSSGNEGVIELIKVRKQKPDIIVFSNDEMAIGGAIQLETMGYSVPQDIRITGFDDIENAKSFSVPLTTVKQPFYEMGQSAMRKIHQVLSGLEVDGTDYVSGKLIIRESCGCQNLLPMMDDIHEVLYDFFQADMVYDFDSFEAVISNQREDMAKAFAKIIGASSDDDMIVRGLIHCLEDLIFDLEMKSSDGGFIRSIQKMIKKHLITGDRQLNWSRLIYALMVSMHALNMNAELYKFINEVLQLSSVIINSLMVRDELHRDFKFKELYYRSSSLIRDTSTVHSRDELIAIIQTVVFQNRFKRYYICLFDQYLETSSGIDIEYPEYVNLVFGCDRGQLIENIRYMTSEMLPDKLLYQNDRSDLVFFPLHFKNMHFGFVVADLDSVRNIIFKTLRELICNTLAQLVMMDALTDYNIQLREAAVMDQLTKLYNRRGFHEYGEQMLINAVEHDMHLVAIFGDLDKLKNINDAYGHEAGDYAIATVGKVLREVFSDEDVIGRIGGDEFVILTHENPMNIEDSIQKVSKSLDQLNQTERKPFKISMSFGYAVYDKEIISDFESLIKAADQKLYIDKHQHLN